MALLSFYGCVLAPGPVGSTQKRLIPTHGVPKGTPMTTTAHSPDPTVCVTLHSWMAKQSFTSTFCQH